MGKDTVTRAGYDGVGIPISRSGPWSPVGGSNPGEAWGSRGVSISRGACKDGGEKPGSTKSPDVQRAGGNW